MTSAHIQGGVRAMFPSGLFVVTYDAPECAAATPTDAGAGCVALSPCPSDGSAASSVDCITTP